MGDYESRHEELQQALYDIERLRAELRNSQQETDNLAVEVETLRLNGQVSQLGYMIYQERLRRARDDIRFCLRKLDGERRQALRRLFDLGAE